MRASGVSCGPSGVTVAYPRGPSATFGASALSSLLAAQPPGTTAWRQGAARAAFAAAVQAAAGARAVSVEVDWSGPSVLSVKLTL